MYADLAQTMKVVQEGLKLRRPCPLTCWSEHGGASSDSATGCLILILSFPAIFPISRHGPSKLTRCLHNWWTNYAAFGCGAFLHSGDSELMWIWLTVEKEEEGGLTSPGALGS